MDSSDLLDSSYESVTSPMVSDIFFYIANFSDQEVDLEGNFRNNVQNEDSIGSNYFFGISLFAENIAFLLIH